MFRRSPILRIDRTMHFVFLQDIAFVIFNNLPPRMAAAEMKLNLCCPEECFQAESAGECFIELQMWRSLPLARLSLSTALATICRETLSEAVCMSFASAGPLNMFSLTTG